MRSTSTCPTTDDAHKGYLQHLTMYTDTAIPCTPTPLDPTAHLRSLVELLAIFAYSLCSAAPVSQLRAICNKVTELQTAEAQRDGKGLLR
jgi:hypothetical protein